MPLQQNLLIAVVIVLLVSWFGLSVVDAADTEAHGFLLLNATGRSSGQRPKEVDSNFIIAEQRLRVDFVAWARDIEAAAVFKGDFLYDSLTDQNDIDIREAYVDYATGSFDFRFGRQIATWGVGDLLFINDVFPKDWVSFFSGRPLEYLKQGIDAARMRYSSQSVNAELLLSPFFTPDKLPTAERFFFYDPFATVDDRREFQPAASYRNTELALRLYRRVAEYDVSLYFYRGFWRSPGMRPDDDTTPTQVSVFYPELRVYGASAQGNALGGIVSVELGYYDSRDDLEGDDPAIANSQSRFLLAYQRQLFQDFTLGVQYYTEIMAKHKAYTRSIPAHFPIQRRYRDTLTLRMERLFAHQTLKLVLFGFYNLADQDYLIQPQAMYKLSDEFSVTLGANLFGGKQATTFFGQFNKNDNGYIAFKFDF